MRQLNVTARIAPYDMLALPERENVTPLWPSKHDELPGRWRQNVAPRMWGDHLETCA